MATQSKGMTSHLGNLLDNNVTPDVISKFQNSLQGKPTNVSDLVQQRSATKAQNAATPPQQGGQPVPQSGNGATPTRQWWTDRPSRNTEDNPFDFSALLGALSETPLMNKMVERNPALGDFISFFSSQQETPPTDASTPPVEPVTPEAPAPAPAPETPQQNTILPITANPFEVFRRNMTNTMQKFTGIDLGADYFSGLFGGQDPAQFFSNFEQIFGQAFSPGRSSALSILSKTRR